MDKKNTMLLTVIAVATLLVAVVGATFAYFAISTDQGASSKTTITGTTPENVSSAVALTGSKTLKLTLSAENMSSANKGHYFYATESGTPGEETLASTPKSHLVTVGTATLQGGAEGSTYECKAQYKVTILKDGAGEVNEGNISDIVFNDTDEAVLFLYGEDESVTVPTALNTSDAGLKLSDIITAGESGKTGEVVFKLTSNGDSVSKSLKAALQIKNSDQQQEGRLAGKTFAVNLEATSFTCDAVKAE